MYFVSCKTCRYLELFLLMGALFCLPPPPKKRKKENEPAIYEPVLLNKLLNFPLN